MAGTSTDPAVANRGQSFGSGMIGGQVSPPPSMLEHAQRYNAMVPRNFQPSGSPNGMGMDQYNETLGGKLKVGNGVSSGQYQTTMGGTFQNPNGISTQNYNIQRYYGASNE